MLIQTQSVLKRERDIDPHANFYIVKSIQPLLKGMAVFVFT